MIKKILFTIAATACSLCANAQDSLYVVQNGHTTAAYKLSDIKYFSTERPAGNMQEFSAWEAYPLFAGTANWIHGIYYHDIDRNVSVDYCRGTADPNLRKIRVRGAFGKTDIVFDASGRNNKVTLRPTDTGLKDENGNVIYVADYNSYRQQMSSGPDPARISYTDDESGYIELNLAYYTQDGLIATGREYIVSEDRTAKPDKSVALDYAGYDETGLTINCIHGKDVGQLRVSLVEINLDSINSIFTERNLTTRILTVDEGKNPCQLTIPYDVAQLDTAKQYYFRYTANMDSTTSYYSNSNYFRITDADFGFRFNESGTCDWEHMTVLGTQDKDLWCRYKDVKEDSVTIRLISIKYVFGAYNEANFRLNTQTNEISMEEPFYTGCTVENADVWADDYNHYWHVTRGDSSVTKADFTYDPESGTIRIPMTYYTYVGDVAAAYETICLFKKAELDQSVQASVIGFETDTTGHTLLQVYAQMGADLAYAKLELCQAADSGYIDTSHPLQSMEIRTSGFYTFDIQGHPEGWIVMRGYDYDGNSIGESYWTEAYNINSENDSTVRQRARIRPSVTTLPGGKGNKLTLDKRQPNANRKTDSRLKMMKPEQMLKQE